jgi:GH15 family glucan-1,4-alpha-glucosidase
VTDAPRSDRMPGTPAGARHPVARVAQDEIIWRGGESADVTVTERDADGYADLRTYATIGDGRTVGLVARDGRIDWLPLPSVDCPSPFAAVLDADEGGELSLAPVEPFTVRRRYVPGTNVLETTFTTATGVARVTDSLNTGVTGRLPWTELARRIDGVSGTVRLRGVIAPGTGLRTVSPWVNETVHGRVLRVNGVIMAPRTLNDDGVEMHDDGVTAHFLTSTGSRHLLGLVATLGEPVFLPRPEDMDRAVDRTVEAWQRWSDAFEWDGPWADAVRRSTMLLKQLIHGPSGAVAAAATTSLPESLHGQANWDYRFTWVRDTAYSLTALFRFGEREETQAAISWMLRTIREHGIAPSVFYPLDGSAPDSDVTEHDSPGWRGVGPVVTGNRAGDQLQLGVYGDVFNIVALYVENGNILDEGTGRLLAEIADLAADAWRRPDSGMWELTELRHYTTSKLGCWQALTHAAHLADIGQIPGSPERWRTEADRIRRWVDENAWDDEQGAYVWYPGTSELDASILLHAISGFDRGERMSSTLDALRRHLGAGPHLYRFSGTDEHEGVFVACSYWMVSALALVGRDEEARALMDELQTAPNDVGVLAEMIEPESGAFLGNLPQALSHLALVNAAITVHTGVR